MISLDSKTKNNTGKDHDILLHDTAHVLASALKNIYKDKIKITIGPAIENGFYYDVDCQSVITESDFETIEEEMLKIAKQNLQFIKEEISKEDAIKYFSSIKEDYKVEIIRNIDDKIFIYKHGDFVDLCKGPHSETTKDIRYFKLLRVSGAYWRGDSKNKMLQRIYGTSFYSKEELDEYLNMIKESERRDHRKIGKELHLFHFQDGSQGNPFWHEKGWTINLLIEEYIRNQLKIDGYKEVKTPVIYNRDLWERSGHWEKFHENMFSFQQNEEDFVIKPMNCPAHVQIFNQEIRSYRDLPFKISEFGICHRNEASGALHGLMRVRSFRQDDGHIFCTLDQITEETLKFIKSLFKVYEDFGFTDIKIKFSDRPQKRAGTDEIWSLAENSLITALSEANLDYEINKGEGAFYGPKIEFTLIDALKRPWQCGTIQVDMVLPERLSAFYVEKDNKKNHPVMLHRAILGSFERFIGILIEHYEGKFPLWLSPVQIIILTISNKQEEYAKKVNEKLISNNLRSKIYEDQATLSKKINESRKEKIPIMIILGDNEVSNESVTLRVRNSEEKYNIPLDNLIYFIHNNCRNI